MSVKMSLFKNLLQKTQTLLHVGVQFEFECQMCQRTNYLNTTNNSGLTTTAGTVLLI